MKKYFFKVPKALRSKVFTRLDAKYEVIRVLMNAVKIMLMNQICSEKEAELEDCYICVCISNMKRVIFVEHGKITSIIFPYTIELENETLIVSEDLLEVDNQYTSHVITMINYLDSTRDGDALDFASEISELGDSTFWSRFKSLMFREYGYLRYDFDESRSKEKIHPLHHLDIFFVNLGTFKVGLDSELNLNRFLDILNVNTDCHFLRT